MTKPKMKLFRLTILLALITLMSHNALNAQNVIENEEAYLKEFDLESFKDAAIKVKDSSSLYMHLIGVKYGYSISSVSFAHTNVHKSIKSPKNLGIYYTYLHSMLGNMPYFGLQTGVAATQIGYTHLTEVDEEVYQEQAQVYDAIQVPLISLFRADINWIRLMLGIGGYVSYIYNTELSGGIPPTTKRGNFGLMGQAGFAVKMNKVELHVEASYQYGLTAFVDHNIYSENQWVYSHPTQLQVSAGLHFVVGRKYYNK